MSNVSQSVFPRLSRDEMPEHMQEIWDQSMQRRGEANFIESSAHSPEIFDWYIQRFYKELFYAGKAPAKYKELGRLRLSLEHGCKTCNQGNRIDAMEAGITETQIERLQAATNEHFSDAELAVVNLAEEIALTNVGGNLSEALYSELREHFDEGQIFELGMVFGLLAGMAKFMFVFDIVVKEDYCPFHA